MGRGGDSGSTLLSGRRRRAGGSRSATLDLTRRVRGGEEAALLEALERITAPTCPARSELRESVLTQLLELSTLACEEEATEKPALVAAIEPLLPQLPRARGVNAVVDVVQPVVMRAALRLDDATAKRRTEFVADWLEDQLYDEAPTPDRDAPAVAAVLAGIAELAETDPEGTRYRWMTAPLISSSGRSRSVSRWGMGEQGRGLSGEEYREQMYAELGRPKPSAPIMDAGTAGRVRRNLTQELKAETPSTRWQMRKMIHSAHLLVINDLLLSSWRVETRGSSRPIVEQLLGDDAGRIGADRDEEQMRAALKASFYAYHSAGQSCSSQARRQGLRKQLAAELA